MHGIMHVPVLFCAVVAGDDHITSHGYADDHVHEKVDEGGGRPDGGQSELGHPLRIRETADNDHIRSVEEKLQDAGKH